MPVAPITDVSQALLGTLAVFLAAIPAILGAVLILILGWIVSAMLGRFVSAILRRIRVDQLADRSGASGVLARSGVRIDVSTALGGFVKWYLRLIFILMAANAVGITAIASIVNQVLAFLPNLVVAAVILVVFGWLAGVTRSAVRGGLGASMPSADTPAMLAYVAVFGFGIVAALDQIGVAQSLINALVIGVVAALALAFGLAFGLGGRDEAAAIWRDWRAHATRAMAGPPEADAPSSGNQEERAAQQRQREVASRSS